MCAVTKQFHVVVILLAIILSGSFLHAHDCHYELPGDWNNDCVVDIVDFAVVADHWLIDCINNYDPACVPLDSDNDGVDYFSDCDDHDPNNYPGGVEVCDGQDNNCDALIDEGCSTEICNGLDDDGDGLIDGDDPDMVTPLCSQQLGVCSGASQMCIAGSLVLCNDGDYSANDPAYEQTEYSCGDGVDNDCDGGC